MMEKESGSERKVANDSGSPARKSLDPRILRIAEAIGRQLARQHAMGRPPHPANDNTLQAPCSNAEK